MSEELRYEPVPFEVTDFCEEVRKDNFPDLEGAEIMYVFDNKKKVSVGKFVIARMKKLNDEMKYLAMSGDGSTYDYAMFIDKLIWNALDEIDRKRIAYHEFCHCEVNVEKKNPYCLKDHEIQGFYDEIIYNADDPRWVERISVVAESVHDPENEE